MCSCLCIYHLLPHVYFQFLLCSLMCRYLSMFVLIWLWWLEFNIEQVRRVLKQTWQETSYYHKTCVLTDCFLALLAPCFQKDKVQLDSSFFQHLSWRVCCSEQPSSSWVFKEGFMQHLIASMFGLFKKSARGWVISATTSWSPRTCWATSARRTFRSTNCWVFYGRGIWSMSNGATCWKSGFLNNRTGCIN